MASAPANLGNLILSPGGHQYQNYATLASHRRGERRDSLIQPAAMRTARGTGRTLPVGSVTESDGGEQSENDPLEGKRVTVAASDDYRQKRIEFYSRIRQATEREAIHQARLERERRRQAALEEGSEYNSDEELLVRGPADDFLTVPEHIARREYPAYMSNVYEVTLNPFSSSSGGETKHGSLTTMYARLNLGVRVSVSYAHINSSLNVWNTMLGTSILAMPWAIKEAGFLTALICCFAAGGISCYTAVMIDRMHKKAIRCKFLTKVRILSDLDLKYVNFVSGHVKEPIVERH